MIRTGLRLQSLELSSALSDDWGWLSTLEEVLSLIYWVSCRAFYLTFVLMS